MTDQEIKETYERDAYVVVKDIIKEDELNPIRNFIKTGVGKYAREQYAAGKLASLYEDESFGRRYAAICEEQKISHGGWLGGRCVGREFYDLYNLPGVIRILGLIMGPEVSNIGSPALRTKLPGNVKTSYPWHQDSQYVDQSTIGKKEKHTAHLHMVTVWVPLVEATVENGCCWVIPGSHRWGLLDGARGEDTVVRMEEDVEARGNPVAVPLKPGGALFMSNLTAHRSKLNTTQGSRWSIDFRYFPIPDRADLTAEQRKEAEFMENRKTPTLIVLTSGEKTPWEEWEAKF